MMTRNGVAAILTLVLSACDPGDVVLLAPEKTTGDVPVLTIHAVIDTPYATVATGLGWTEGVPGAQVRVHLMEEPYEEAYWHVATADSTGVATLTDLLSGLYEVAVTRWLTGPELVQADSGLRLLAGGRRLYVSRGSDQEVTMVPDHRGSLVFAEFWTAQPPNWETGGIVYADSYYLEIYNNSDTTIYLDGKYFGTSWNLNRDYPTYRCAVTEVVRNDPNGIWTRWILRFPGGGSEYPLAPGQTALVAQSAIDHRAILPTLPDLRDADFEWGGTAGADNPDVPNLQDIGPSRTHYLLMAHPYFLAEGVDLGTLPQWVWARSGDVYVRIPGTKLLDVYASTADWTSWGYVPPGPACLEETNRRFDNLPGPASALVDYPGALSFQRRVLYVLPDGRKVLQDTDTSMEDFVKAVRTPGWIPDSLGR
jgi:hypothetical protein